MIMCNRPREKKKKKLEQKYLFTRGKWEVGRRVVVTTDK